MHTQAQATILTATPAATATADHPKTLVIVSGKKGGVGKSIVSAAVFEYLLPHHGPAIGLYDLDGDDGDLRIRYRDSATPLNPRRIDDFGAIIDDLMDPMSPISIAVVDVGAPAGALLDRFLIEGGPADAAESGHLKVVVLWVVGGTPRSMTYLAESMTVWDDANLRDHIDLTIVANHGQGSRFDFIAASSSAEGVPVVEFPRLEEEAAQEVTNLKAGFRSYTALDRFGPNRPSYSRQSMVNRWLARTADAFDRIPALAALTQAVPLDALPVPTPDTPTPHEEAPSYGAPPTPNHVQHQAHPQMAHPQTFAQDVTPATPHPMATADDAPIEFADDAPPLNATPHAGTPTAFATTTYPNHHLAPSSSHATQEATHQTAPAEHSAMQTPIAPLTPTANFNSTPGTYLRQQPSRPAETAATPADLNQTSDHLTTINTWPSNLGTLATPPTPATLA